MKTLCSCLIQILIAIPALAQVSVSGQVLDVETGGKLEGVRIEMMSEYGIATTRDVQTTTNGLGRYMLANVPRGQWRFRAQWGNRYKGGYLMTPVIEVDNDSLTFDFQFRMHQEPVRYWSISGQMIKTDSSYGHRGIWGIVQDPQTLAPVDSAIVRIMATTQSASDTTESREHRSTTTDKLGRFDIPEYESGTYTVLVEKPGYETAGTWQGVFKGPEYIRILLPTESFAEASRAQERGSRGRIISGGEDGSELRNIVAHNFILSTGRLKGKITRNGQPLPNATLRLEYPEYGWIDEYLNTKSDQDGMFMIGLVQTGVYDLLVDAGNQTIRIPSVFMDNDMNELNIDM